MLEECLNVVGKLGRNWLDEGVAFVNVFLPSLYLLPCEDMAYSGEGGTSPVMGLDDNLIIDFPVRRTTRKKFLFFLRN